MPLTWTLKEWLTTNGDLQLPTNNAYTNAKAIQNIIHTRTGYKLSLRAVHNLLERQPKTLDSRTLQLICDAFRCQLDDFCAVTPSSSSPVNLANELHLQPSEGQFSPLAIGEKLKDRQHAQARWHISYALTFTNWNKTAAARLLGITRQALRDKMIALEMSCEKPRKLSQS